MEYVIKWSVTGEISSIYRHKKDALKCMEKYERLEWNDFILEERPDHIKDFQEVIKWITEQEIKGYTIYARNWTRKIDYCTFFTFSYTMNRIMINDKIYKPEDVRILYLISEEKEDFSGLMIQLLNDNIQRILVPCNDYQVDYIKRKFHRYEHLFD